MKLLQQYLANKTFYLTAFLMIIFFVLPATIIMIETKQHTKSSAAASTIVSLSPTTSQASPITKNVNDIFPLDVMVDPGTNAVSLMTIVLQYDPTKLRVDPVNGFQMNQATFPSILEGPVYSDGQVAVQLSIGSDPTKAITQVAKAGTFQFTAIGGTGTGTTTVTFSTNTQALSVGANDQASENVISSTQPAYITIPGNTQAPTPDLTNAPTGTNPTSSLTPTDSLTPTGGVGGGVTPPVLPTASPSATPTLIPGSPSARFHGLQTSVMMILSNRIAHCPQLLAKVDKDKRIPDSQKQAIKTEITNRCTVWQSVLKQVSTAANDAQIKQAIVTAVNAMNTNYTALLQQLGTLNQGMQLTAKKLNGKHSGNVQSLINSMNSQLKSLHGFAGNIQGNANGIPTATSSTALTNIFQSVHGNLGQIRSGLMNVKHDLQSVATEVEQGTEGPTGTATPTTSASQPTASPTP